MAEITIPADEAVKELNERFRRVGYRFENGKIIRIDNEFLQSGDHPSRSRATERFSVRGG
jgi:hypothetical protein